MSNRAYSVEITKFRFPDDLDDDKANFRPGWLDKLGDVFSDVIDNVVKNVPTMSGILKPIVDETAATIGQKISNDDDRILVVHSSEYEKIDDGNGRWTIEYEDLELPAGVDATAKLTSANIGAVFSTRPSMENPVSAYLHLGLGFTRGTGQVSGSFLGENINVSTSSTSFSFLVGIGMKYAVTESVSFMVDTRYNHAIDHFDSSSQWIPFTAGLSFAFPE